MVEDEKNVYVVGDSGQLELPYGENSYLPKGIEFYKGQAKTVAARIEESIFGNSKESLTYDPSIDYQLYVGNGEYIDISAKFLPSLSLEYKPAQKSSKRVKEMESRINKCFT